MRQVVQWVMVVALCCVGCAVGGQAGMGNKWKPNERLVEAQADFDAALKFEEAGEYAKALARAEHALMIREAVLGRSHEGIARSLSLVGRLYQKKGDLA
ncbi:tetratricopeptide repeat protein [Cystobacter fuscus]|uniref:tetratricopeptide repeat protein n=1 Tax=Cystobacter fuscus TaxID=43 RepID=UPI0037C04405